MDIYNLVAYHNLSSRRETLETSTSLGTIKSLALITNPIKYKEFYLAVEVEGEILMTFSLQNDKFIEKPLHSE